MIQTAVGGSNGDGYPAEVAKIDPQGMAWDRYGNLFIADSSGNRIRRIDAGSGVITTVAGTGTAGFSGDGGPATSANLNGPYGLAVDRAGNIIFADGLNHCVRRVDAGTGVITTVAGNRNPSFSGDGGPATSASLYYPVGISLLPDGSILIADSGNKRIRKVTPNGTIFTVAGNGNLYGGLGDGQLATNAYLCTPLDVVADAQGNFFIADEGTCRIRRVNAATQIITTVAGNGTCSYTGDGLATATALNGPGRVTVDAQGNLYIAEMFVARVREVLASGMLTTIAGGGAGCSGDGGPATRAGLVLVGGLLTDSVGTLYIADSGANNVRHIDTAGIIWTVVGGANGDGYPAEVARLDPEGMDWDAGGNLLISDGSGNRIRRVDAVSGIITTIAGTGKAGFAGDGGLATAALLSSPAGLVVDSAGNIYFSDSNNHRVRRVDRLSSLVSTVAGTGTSGYNGDGAATRSNLYYPLGLAPLADGSILIADSGNKLVRQLTPNGMLITVAGGGSPYGGPGDGQVATTAYLAYPVAVSVDSVGNFYIADLTACRIRRVDGATQIISTVAGGAVGGAAACGYASDGVLATATTLNGPDAVAVDAEGDIFIAERGAPRLRAVDAATVIITTIAGNGSPGYSGDGGPATAARLTRLSALAIPMTVPSAPLYVGDSGASNIRTIVLNAAPPTVSTRTPTRTPTPAPSLTRTSTPVPTPAGSMSIAGQVHYYSDQSLPVSGVTVSLQNTTAGNGTPSAVTQTDSTGRFSFLGVATGNWKISPQKSGDAGSAIDISDAVTILQSVVGVISLTPGQRLACDVSGDGGVTILDAVLVLQHLVGLTPRFPVAEQCGSDWAFVPDPAPATNQQVLMPQIASGVCRNGAIAFSPLTTSASNQNFSAVLFGDCTGNWQPAARVPALALTADASGAVSLGHPSSRQGRRVRVPLSVHSPQGFSALSVQVGYDPSHLTVVGVRAVGTAREALMQFNRWAPGSLKIVLASGSLLPDGAVLMLDFEARRGFRSRPPIHIQHAAVR